MNNVRALFNECTALAKKKLRCCTTTNHNSDGNEPQIVIKGVGVTNQRETVVAWNRLTGKPLYNAIVWLDTRTKNLVDEIKAKHGGSVDALREVSGLPLHSYFSASKMKWLIDNVEAVRLAVKEDTCRFGTIDTWLIWVSEA